MFHGEPRSYQITRRARSSSAAICPTPRIDVRAYEHDVGVAWLWLAAHDGTFGPLRGGHLRAPACARTTARDPGPSRSGSGSAASARAAASGCTTPTCCSDRRGRRVALELELTPKGRARLEKILAGYAADPRIDGVVYLVREPPVGAGAFGGGARGGWASRTWSTSSASSTVSTAASARAEPRTHRARADRSDATSRARAAVGEAGGADCRAARRLPTGCCRVRRADALPAPWRARRCRGDRAAVAVGARRVAAVSCAERSARTRRDGRDRARRSTARGRAVRLSDHELSAHGLILGASGAGKTTTLLTILDRPDRVAAARSWRST